MQLRKYLIGVALSAAALLSIMVAIGIQAGVSQQDFEWLDLATVYGVHLEQARSPLLLILGLDNLFIFCYSSLLILLTIHLWQRRTRTLLIIFVSCGLLAGLLDLMENHHIFTMLYGMRLELVPDQAEIKDRMLFSMLKWHLAYFAFFLLGFALPFQGLLVRVFRCSLWFLQAPVGVFYYCLAQVATIGPVLFYLRYTNLVAGFILLAVLFSRQRPDSPLSRAAHGHTE